MALGKNLKIDKLIPENEESIVSNKKKKKPASKKKAISIKETELEVEDEARTVKIIVEPSRRKSVNKAKVYIEGRLEVANAKYITRKIQEIIETYNVIEFRLRNVVHFDLSAIQIFYYVMELSDSEKKSISFQLEELPVALKVILVKTKYNKILFKK